MTNKKRKQACQNCEFGTIIRYESGFPDVRCDFALDLNCPEMTFIMAFGSCCDDYEPGYSMRKHEEQKSV